MIVTVYEYALSLVNGKEFTEKQELEDVADKVCSQHDVECKLCYAGSFNSPGIDSEYYAFVIIENGILLSFPVQVDSY